MKKTEKTDYKRKYAMAKHHAWAGSVLLAILGAIRWYAIDTEYPQKDLIFIIFGILIIIYILIALFFTYRFRSGLAEEETQINQRNISNQSSSQPNSETSLSPKDLAKIEKKKAKAESKQLKKLAKAKEKQEKKSS
jgi:uncharacterized membrane protein YuzA (DUF378 family)